jgi:hypothetical protein
MLQRVNVTHAVARATPANEMLLVCRCSMCTPGDAVRARLVHQSTLGLPCHLYCSCRLIMGSPGMCRAALLPVKQPRARNIVKRMRPVVWVMLLALVADGVGLF